MYYLIKTDEMFSLGGSGLTKETKLIKKSKSKAKLRKFLKQKFSEAEKDDEVEYINACEKTEIRQINISDELLITYKDNGYDVDTVEYIIVSDKETEMI